MVYFGSVNDASLKRFTDLVSVDKKYTLSEIAVSDYWSVEDLGTVLKCIPLFHTEEITSSNSADVVLDKNKCIIAVEDSDTVITCKGQVTSSIVHSIRYHLFAYTLNNTTLYCIVTDEYNNLLPDTTITVYKNSTLESTVKTGADGICKYTVSGTGTYKFNLDIDDSNNVVIT